MTTFEYLSVFVSIVLGLAVVRLLRGLVGVLTGEDVRPYWVHLLWLGFFVVWLPYFWWFTFGWRETELWTYPVFFFIVAYAMLIYALVAVVVPDEPSKPRDYESYFFRIKRPMFVLFAVLMLMDVGDSLLKGPENMDRLGSTYIPIMVFWITGHAVASHTASRRYHAGWVVVYLVTMVMWSIGGWAEAFGS